MIERASNVEDLRRAFAAGSEKPSPEGGCPEPERLWAAAAGELPVAERRAVISHTAHCAACAEDFRLAAHVVREAPGRAPAAVVREFPVRRWLGGALAAAAVVAVLMVGVQGRFGGGPDPSLYRAGGEQAIHSLLGERPSLARDAVVLRWDGPADARYDVFVQTTGLKAVSAARDLEVNEFRVPSEDLVAFPTGTRLFWRIEATLPDGARLDSPAFEVWIEE